MTKESPWLHGREQELRAFNERIERAGVERQRAKGEDKTQLRRVKLKARKEKARATRKWEEDWWMGIAKRAEEAARVGNQGELYKLISTLKAGRGALKARKRHKGEVTAEEMEEWRKHFA